MTLLEYVDSLFQQNVPEEEIVAKTQEWKKKIIMEFQNKSKLVF